jgi:hypothetical protein
LKSIGDIEEEMVIYETNTKIDALTSPVLNFEVQDRGKFFAEFYREIYIKNQVLPFELDKSLKNKKELSFC